MRSGRTGHTAVAQSGGADAGEGAEEDMPGAAEKALRNDGSRGARQPDQDVGVTPPQSNRECQEHRGKGEVEAETPGVAGGAAEQMSGHPGCEPGAVEQDAGTHEETGQS